MGAVPVEGVDHPGEAGAGQETSGDSTMGEANGLSMLGTAEAEVCDENGVCAVPAPRTEQHL